MQGALQGATNYLFNSTVKLNETYILSNSTVGFISFTIGMKNRLSNGTVGAIQNIASTVQLKQTHILIQSLSRLGIITGTCLHSQNSRHHMGCNRLATSVPDIWST